MRAERGFTLIELLVVISIVGILAAIAVPTLAQRREAAFDAQAKSAARGAQTAMETYASDREPRYEGVMPADLRSVDETLPATGLSVSDATTTTYTVTVAAPANPTTFSIVRAATGEVRRTCAPVARHGEGGCRSDGTW